MAGAVPKRWIVLNKHNDAAHAMLDAGDAQGALHLLQQAQARGVSNDFTVAIYANALQQSGQAQQAMDVRQQKIDGNSRNVVFYNDQANSHYQRGDYASALAVLDLARQRGLSNQVTEPIRAKTKRMLGR